jgi:hypothetical protein
MEGMAGVIPGMAGGICATPGMAGGHEPIWTPQGIPGAGIVPGAVKPGGTVPPNKKIKYVEIAWNSMT